MSARWLILCLLLISGLAVWLWVDAMGAPGPLLPAGDQAPIDGSGRPPAAEQGQRPSEREPMAVDVGTPAAGESRQVVIDDACTARFVRFGSNKGLSGVAVVQLPELSILATSDRDGRCELEGVRGQNLVAMADGYLLRRFVPRAAIVGDRIPTVELRRDNLSPRVRFELAVAVPVTAARAVLECTKARDPAAVTAAGGAALAAWSEHRMLAELGLLADWHRGTGAAQPLPVGSWRLAAAGDYQIVVADPSGVVGQASFSVVGEADVDTVVAIDLRAGAFLDGQVVDATTNLPLSAAVIEVDGVDPLGLQVQSGSEGGFRIGPLCASRVGLRAGLAGREPLRAGPFDATSGRRVRLAMAPRAARTISGVVRSRPDHALVVGATVEIHAGGKRAIQQTKGDGRFEIAIEPGQPVRLSIRSPDHVRYVESFEAAALVQAGALTCDLLPGNEALRVATGISGLVRGTVVDGNGDPVVDVMVRLQPREVTGESPPAGRKIIEGYRLGTPLMVRTDADGAFRFETVCAGGARLMVLGKGSPALSELELRLGETTSVGVLRIP